MKSSVAVPLSFSTIVVVLCVFCLYGISVGPAEITPVQVLHAFFSRLVPAISELKGNLLDWQETIIWQVRIPRVVVAACVGATLAVCGATLQSLFRNPLASPDILGVTSGASLGAAIAIFFGLSSLHVFAIPGFAIVASILSMALVYSVSVRNGKTALATLILAGVAVSALNGSIRSFVLSLALKSYEVGSAIIYWSLGSLEGRTWEHVWLILPVFVIGYFIIRRQYRELDILLLGEVHASAVGVDVPRIRLQLLMTTAVMGAVAVAASGGIGFVGLVAPHMVRLVIGPKHRYLLPISALTGASMLVGSDLLLRSVFADFDIPVGALTALFGAPFFVFLLLRQRRMAML